MQKVFDEILENISDNSFYSIWNELFQDREYLDEASKKEEFLKFFDYGIEKNTLLEYDVKNKTLVFSRDEPSVVVERIFSDLRTLDIYEDGRHETKAFLGYAFTKAGWAVLRGGTYLFLPD